MNVPESVVVMPFACPSIVMETPANAFSFSPRTFPLTVADFFCAKEIAETRVNKNKNGMRLAFTKADLVLK